jgi:arginyl-tRNA synthetase
MLALTGNTAPYMQYAYARIRSIFRKGAEQVGEPTEAPIRLAEPAERELGKRLLGFEETLRAVSADNKPNYLTSYLFDLASAFSGFYENCPVLQAAPEVRDSRLRLCELTARVIRRGLDLLGIAVIEQM